MYSLGSPDGGAIGFEKGSSPEQFNHQWMKNRNYSKKSIALQSYFLHQAAWLSPAVKQWWLEAIQTLNDLLHTARAEQLWSNQVPPSLMFSFCQQRTKTKQTGPGGTKQVQNPYIDNLRRSMHDADVNAIATTCALSDQSARASDRASSATLESPGIHYVLAL